MAKFVWCRKARDWIDPRDAAPVVMGKGINIIRDIDPYRSIIDGSVIGGRRQHRDHLRAHGVEELGNEKIPPRKREPQGVGQDIKRAIEELS